MLFKLKNKSQADSSRFGCILSILRKRLTIKKRYTIYSKEVMHDHVTDVLWRYWVTRNGYSTYWRIGTFIEKSFRAIGLLSQYRFQPDHSFEDFWCLWLEMRTSRRPITKLALKNLRDDSKKEFGEEIINVSDRGTMCVTKCNLSIYLLLLTTLYVSALFLSLGRHCLLSVFRCS